MSEPTPEPPPQPSLAPGSAGAAAAEPDLDLALGKPKGVPVVVTIAAILGSLGIGTALGALVLGGSAENQAVATASASAPPPAASSAPPPPPPPPPKSLAEKASEGDPAAFKELEGKATRERTSAETLALFQGDLAQKQKALEELARKTELVAAFGKSEDTQKTFVDAVKDPRQSTATLEILAKMSGPMGPDYLYKVYRVPGRQAVTEKLVLDLLLSKDIYGKASDALKIVLDMDQAIQAESKDCPGMIKLLVRAQADADTRAFRPIASLNSKRGCGDNKLKDCWECLRDGEGKDALNDAIKLARKNKAPF